MFNSEVPGSTTDNHPVSNVAQHLIEQQTVTMPGTRRPAYDAFKALHRNTSHGIGATSATDAVLPVHPAHTNGKEAA